MKVLMVLNPLLTDYQKSGSAMVAVTTANTLVRMGHEVGFIANEVIKNLVDERCKVHTVDNVSSKNYMRETIARAVNLVKIGEYDIFHCHIHQVSVINSLIEVPDDIPFVYTQHTKDVFTNIIYRYRGSAWYLSFKKKNARIVFPAYSLIDVWNKYIESDTQGIVPNGIVIRNGIKVSDVTDVPNKYTAITCSGIDNNKGIATVLAFVNKYEIPSMIIGTKRESSNRESKDIEDYYNMFMSYVEAKPDCVEYSPLMKNDEVRKKMMESKIYISNSAKEVCPLSIAEALSVGTPILCAYESGICELLDEKSSVVIPAEELYRKRMSSRVEIFKKYYDIMMNKIDKGDITRESVLERFRSLKMTDIESAQEHINLYNTLINKE